MSKYQVIAYEHEKHSAAFLRFIEKVRGSELFANRKKAYDWFHSDYPLRERTPLRFIIQDGERIIGSMGHMPANYMIKGKKVPVRITHDLLVDPDYRGLGLAKKLVENAKNTGDFFPGGMWMNNPCYKIHLSCGFDDVLAPQTRTLVLDAKAFTLHQGIHFTKRIAMQAFLSMSLRKAKRKAFAYLNRKAKRLSLKEIHEFDPKHNSMWESVLKSYSIAACRDAAFLNWKYAHHPVVSYRLLLAERNGKVSGYLVWRLPFGKGPQNRVIIVDYLVERRDVETFQSMISKIILEATDHGVETLSIMTTQPWSLNLLKTFGFLTSRGKHTWVIANWRNYFPEDWLNNHENWHICLGDSDGDFWAGGQ